MELGEEDGIWRVIGFRVNEDDTADDGQRRLLPRRKEIRRRASDFDADVDSGDWVGATKMRSRRWKTVKSPSTDRDKMSDRCRSADEGERREREESAAKPSNGVVGHNAPPHRRRIYWPSPRPTS
uniref:Uncharacterized protein n=1 Tax=Plectus sambesii TaxID=2011161 RepID=A0A914W104_9BILA